MVSLPVMHLFSAARGSAAEPGLDVVRRLLRTATTIRSRRIATSVSSGVTKREGGLRVWRGQNAYLLRPASFSQTMMPFSVSC